MSTLDTIQAAIDLAWEYTDDPDECDALSAANQAIEELRSAVATAKVLRGQREALLEVEGETGYLNIDAIHGNEDDAVGLVSWLADQ
jgi:hypothetical protein